MAQPENNSSSLEDDRTLRIPSETLPFWDISDFPTRNLPFAKTGSGLALKGAVIGVVDKRARRKFVDGLQGDPKEKLTWADVIGTQLVDPNSWVLRLLQTKGQGNLSVWMPRIVADNTNPDSSIENRGWMVVDFEDDQRYAWFSDQFQVSGRSASVAGPELAFNGAAFLGMLYPKEKPSGAVAVHHQLAQKIHANQGLVTDGNYLGAWAHVVGFKGGGGGGTTAGGKGGGRPSKTDDLLLLAEAGYLYQDGRTVSLPVMDPAGPDADPVDEGEARLVHFYQGQQLGNGIKVATDGNSNFSPIKRKSHAAISAYVKVKPPG